MFAAFRSRRTDNQSSSDRTVRPSFSEISRLFRYLRPYIKPMGLAVISLMGGTALGLVFPWIIQNLIDTVLATKDIQQLNQITIILIITFLIRSIFYYFQVYTLSFVGERIVVDIRRQTYNHLLELSLSFYNDRRVGELISRLSSDVTLIRTVLTNNVATVLSQSLTFIGSLVLMLVLNWRLTLFILILAPIIIMSAAFFGMRLRRLSTVVQDELAESTALAEQALSSVRVVKAFNREPFEDQRYGEKIERTFTATMRMTRLRAAFSPLISFLAFSSLAAILWFGGREVVMQRLTAGALVAFLVYGINIAASLGSFTGLYTQLQEAAGASRRVFELLDEVPQIVQLPAAPSMPSIMGHIVFENVSFAYPGSVHVLHDINLEIHPGEILALVGPSGAGKSTLFNLIPRFYDPNQGCIRIDGQDIRNFTLASLRQQVGIVPQETQLFSGSIKENIQYGKLDADDAEIKQAARAANAENFILELEKGYDTLVGERGVKLSGGQRQRIAIARALLKDPRVLLLDEATSSLDTESEQLVQQALEYLMRGRTTIIIAHRLSTVHRADRIAVLDNGYLIELGNHKELIDQDGLYARLYRLQFRLDQFEGTFQPSYIAMRNEAN